MFKISPLRKEKMKKERERKLKALNLREVASLEKNAEQLKKALQYLESRFEPDELKFAKRHLKDAIQKELRKVADAHIEDALKFD